MGHAQKCITCTKTFPIRKLDGWKHTTAFHKSSKTNLHQALKLLSTHTPSTPANINIMSYAKYFTITSTHNDIHTATAQLQIYLNTLQTWFDSNRLKVAPTKSTFTLLTNYTKEHQHTPQLRLDNTAIPHKHSTKVLGVTYDTSLSFKDHIHDIKQKCTHRLNTLRTLTETDFGPRKIT